MTNQELIQEAAQVVHPKTIGDSTMGGVGCALITDSNSLFKGVCIDTGSGMGFCAEHAAISQMITNGEYRIKKIVAVAIGEDDDLFILSPCGRCREFMRQTNEANLDTDIVLDEDKVVKLKDLLPYYDWKQKIQ
jgi:cytidine deaminase